jgi:hypothetical protein
MSFRTAQILALTILLPATVCGGTIFAKPLKGKDVIRLSAQSRAASSRRACPGTPSMAASRQLNTTRNWSQAAPYMAR